MRDFTNNKNNYFKILIVALAVLMAVGTIVVAIAVSNTGVTYADTMGNVEDEMSTLSPVTSFPMTQAVSTAVEPASTQANDRYVLVYSDSHTCDFEWDEIWGCDSSYLKNSSLLRKAFEPSVGGGVDKYYYDDFSYKLSTSFKGDVSNFFMVSLEYLERSLTVSMSNNKLKIYYSDPNAVGFDYSTDLISFDNFVIELTRYYLSFSFYDNSTLVSTYEIDCDNVSYKAILDCSMMFDFIMLSYASFFEEYSCVETISCYNLPTYPLPPMPTKEGYTFIGWYYGTEDECKSLDCVTYDSDVIYSDTNLHAHFEINRYNVIFDSNGGSYVDSQIVDWNKSATLSTPTRKGYSFVGWYLPNSIKYESQPIKDNTTLVAHWEVIKCAVTFYVDGEIYEIIKVDYGTKLVDVVETANAMNLQVMSLSLSNDTSIGDVDKVTTVSGDLEVTALIMDGKDKVVNTVKNNKWTIIGGLAGCIALIALLVGIGGSLKRKIKI